MEIGSAITVSVGIVTFGGVALSVIKNNRRGNSANPGSNKFVSGKECVAHRQGFEKQMDSMKDALSKEIGLTRDTLVREIGEVKSAIQK